VWTENPAGSSTGTGLCRQNSGVGPSTIRRIQSVAGVVATIGASASNSAG
jgi:hypothetical protein